MSLFLPQNKGIYKAQTSISFTDMKRAREKPLKGNAQDDAQKVAQNVFLGFSAFREA